MIDYFAIYALLKITCTMWLKVAMVPDFSAVLVHWIVSGVKEKDDITQERLEMNAKRIR